MNFLNDVIGAYRSMLQNYFNMHGRCSRAQYWLAFLGNFCVSLAIAIVVGILQLLLAILKIDNGFINFVLAAPATLYSLFVVIPGITMAVRRLHDSGKAGWLVAVCYVASICCGIGAIALIVLCVLPGTQGPNMYGDDPRASQNFWTANKVGAMFNGNNQAMNQQMYNQNPQYGNMQQPNNGTGMNGQPMNGMNGQPNGMYGGQPQQNQQQRYNPNQQYGGGQPYNNQPNGGQQQYNPNNQYGNGNRPQQ